MTESSDPRDKEAKRRKIAEIFGDVLPGTTRDERDPEGNSGNEQRIRNDVPPHWQ
jgi:hypothetical protein